MICLSSLLVCVKDNIRLGSPTRGPINDYEGPKRTMFLSRNALGKLRGRVIKDLRDVVGKEGIGTPEVRQRMTDSMRRVDGMCDFVAHLNSLAESINTFSSM